MVLLMLNLATVKLQDYGIILFFGGFGLFRFLLASKLWVKTGHLEKPEIEKS